MAKAMYVGIGGVARKVKNGYLGVGGVTRFVRRGYLGVRGVARYFLYDFGTASVHLSPASADTDASSYTMTRGYGTLSLRLVTTMGGSSSSSYNGFFYACVLNTLGTAFGGSKLSVTISSMSGYDEMYGMPTIEFWGSTGTKAVYYPKSAGAYSYTVPSGADRIVFGVWNRYAHTGYVTYSSIKLNDVTVDLNT